MGGVIVWDAFREVPGTEYRSCTREEQWNDGCFEMRWGKASQQQKNRLPIELKQLQMEILAVAEPATQMTVWDCTSTELIFGMVQRHCVNQLYPYTYTVLCRSLVGIQGRYELTSWSSEGVQNICWFERPQHALPGVLKAIASEVSVP